MNAAARLETHSESGRINVSDRVYHQMAPYFDFTGQGSIDVKNKAPMTMYFLDRLKDIYSEDLNGRIANQKLLSTTNPMNVRFGD